MLAQAIVGKTLDMERQRQAEVRRRLDRIAKIELVKKVRVSIPGHVTGHVTEA